MKQKILSGIAAVESYILFALALLGCSALYSAMRGKEYASFVGSFILFGLIYGVMIALRNFLQRSVQR